jgi:hypothetical protein
VINLAENIYSIEDAEGIYGITVDLAKAKKLKGQSPQTAMRIALARGPWRLHMGAINEIITMVMKDLTMKGAVTNG